MVLKAFSRKLWFAIRISMCLNRRMEFLEVARHSMGQLISLQTSIEKSIDFLPLELWKLHSSFLLRFLLIQAMISCPWISGSSTAHFYQDSNWEKHWFLASGALDSPRVISTKIPIEKSIDFLSLELWKLHSSFLYRFSLRKALSSCLWSSASCTAHFYTDFHWEKHWLLASGDLEAPQLVGCCESLKFKWKTITSERKPSKPLKKQFKQFKPSIFKLLQIN